MTTKPRVLIVDDKEDNLYYLRTLLAAYGYDVESAAHGAEALTKARHSPPDLIIADLLMPVMDGYTLLRHWKQDEKLKNIPFVVYTATYTAPRTSGWRSTSAPTPSSSSRWSRRPDGAYSSGGFPCNRRRLEIGARAKR